MTDKNAEALERVIMHAKTQVGSFCSMDEYKQNEADCLLLRAALEPQPVDLGEILKELVIFLGIENYETDIEHANHVVTVDETLVYLAKQGYLRQPQEWQPIESCPKNGKRFDIWVWDKRSPTKGKRIADVYWHKKAGCIIGHNPVCQEPTHWLKLQPPTDQED